MICTVLYRMLYYPVIECGGGQQAFIRLQSRWYLMGGAAGRRQILEAPSGFHFSECLSGLLRHSY